MILRWLIYSNPVTAVDVADYRDMHGVSMSEAKARLQMRTAPVLQYSENGVDFYDVPTVVRRHPTNT